jgi:hypothetical protein
MSLLSSRVDHSIPPDMMALLDKIEAKFSHNARRKSSRGK